MNKQKGFFLIQVLVGMGVISLLSITAMKTLNFYHDKKEGELYAGKVELLIEQLKKYNYMSVHLKGNDPAGMEAWPFQLSDLMDGYFWPECSREEQYKRLCYAPDFVSFTNSKIGYTVTPSGDPIRPSKVELTIPLSEIKEKDRIKWSRGLREIPFSTLASNGDIKISLGEPVFTNDQWLKANGETKLSGDWDVGNKAILNTSMISIKGVGETQIPVGIGTVREYIDVSGAWITKSTWDCPEGLIKTVHTSVHSIMAPPGEEYIGVGAFFPWVLEIETDFQVGLEYNAKLKSTGAWQKMKTGYLSIRLNCTQKKASK